ncbi:hypothetical protein C8T65DRAFT_556223, partial [Cerioporus squamosus]
GHVICFGCFKNIIATSQAFCPFRCDMTNRLKLDDGIILELSMKDRDYERDKRTALSKRRVEISHASAHLRKRRNQVRRDMATVTALIRNQDETIANRIRYITRDAVKADKLREQIAAKQARL